MRHSFIRHTECVYYPIGATVQFSLRHLLSLAAFVGVASVAVVYASPLWAAICFTTVVASLLAALVLIPLATGRDRAWWIGYAIFGWGYWAVLHSPLLDFQPSADVSATNWRLQTDGPPLLSSQFLNWAYFNLLPYVHDEPKFDAAGNLLNTSRYPSELDYMRAGHTVFNFLFAMLGAGFGAFAHRRLREPRLTTPSRSGPIPQTTNHDVV